MNGTTGTTEERLRHYLKRVTADLTRTRNRLRDVEARAAEPIAVIGMACRYPGGVDSPEALWRLVEEGREGIGPFPTDRGWELGEILDPNRDRPWTSYVDDGGFIDDVTGFDAEFFGIAPHEALVMDPQHRIALELAWEAVERAGLPAESLRGTDTGVFVGAFDQGYGPHVDQAAESLADFQDTGRSLAALAGRIGYTFGLAGPAVSMDSASTSSLTAMQSAVQSLRSGTCSLALTGGITVFPSPAGYVENSRTGKLSPTARARPFSAAADGPQFSEGAGLVLLERLSDAHRHGHPVWAVIRGVAVMQAGVRHSMETPSTRAEELLFRRALADAGLTAADVDLIEPHSTGRTLGAVMELQALTSVYGAEHDRDRPLYIGSLKSHFGHSVAGSGIGGFLKLVMAMRHGVMPKSLHVDSPMPDGDWSSGTVRLLTETRPWPDTGRPRRAAVTGMAVAGTNGHLVLEHEPEPVPADRSGTTGSVPWLLSARSAPALRAQARRLADRLAVRPEPADSNVGHSLATTRSTMAERALLVGDTATKRAALAALATGAPHPALVRGRAAPGPFVVMFPDPRDSALPPRLRSRPEIAAVVDEVRAAFTAAEASEEVPVDGFADQVAVFALLRGAGVRPERLSGRGLGELAALHCAGALSLPAVARAVVGLLSGRADPVPTPAAEPGIPVTSAATGETVDATALSDPERWKRWRDPDPVTRSPGAEGGTVLVLAGEQHDADDATVVVTGTDPIAELVGRLRLRGVTVDWDHCLPGGRRIDLPTYPFQRKRYWLSPGTAGRDTRTSGLVPLDHGLLGAAVPLADTDEWLVTGRLSTAAHPWLADDVVDGHAVLPVGALVDFAWCAGELVGLPRVAELRVEGAVPLPPGERVSVQLRVGPDRDGRRRLTVHSAVSDDPGRWTRCASGVLAASSRAGTVPSWHADRGTPVEPVPAGSDAAVRTVLSARRDGPDLYARLRLPAEPALHARRFGVHPALLESVRQLAAAQRVELPGIVTDAELWSGGAATAKLRWNLDTGPVWLTDESGSPVARYGVGGPT